MDYQGLFLLLPERIRIALKKIDLSRLQEIRLRKKGVSVNIDGQKTYLGVDGLTSRVDNAIKMEVSEMNDFVLRAAKHSLYLINNQIKLGFISLLGGIRIGLAGEAVEQDGLKTIKNFSSLNIRIPHEIKGCAEKVIRYVCDSDGIRNTVIVSPPGGGKTTMLRDLVRIISEAGHNVLLADERYELASCQSGVPMLDVGINTDILSGYSKNYAFTQGIRCLRPDILACDELMSTDDFLSVTQSIKCGVKVLATVHSDCEHIMLKPIEGIERKIVLSSKRTGEVLCILDENNHKLA